MEKVNTKNKQNKAKSFFLKIIKLAERIIIGKRAEEKEKLIAKERTYVSNNPVSNEEQYAQYIYAIDQKIDEEDIKNIGIVAPYGAGKSSIVKTYFDIHPDKKKKSKTISLASFSFEGSDKDEPRKLKDGEQNRIEKSILEQIVYKRKFCAFSRSNLSRLHDKVLFSIIFSVVIVGSIVSVILSILAFKKALPGFNGNTPYICMGIASIFVLVFIFLSQHALKIRKIAIQNIEIEFENKSNVSPLNKFIDEMINFCFETKIKYFIFEDIDRFNSPELLLKLREINFLINDSDYIKDPVVFIYCVKDTVFNCTEDKYKFFDFVLSPIPIFNNDIAAEEIEERIKTNKGSDIDLDPVSLKEMTRYISEMRVLNGIFNDYLIYKDELNIKREENEKLFAMMIYKNQSFSDFNKLQKNEGLLYRVFHEYKENALRVRDNELSKQINAKKEEFENKTSASAVQERFSNLKTKVHNLIDEKGRLSSTKPVGYVDNEKVNTYLNVADGLFIEINNRHPYYGSATTSYKSLSLKDISDYLGKDIVDIEQDENNTIKANIQHEIHELEQTLISSREMGAADLFLNEYYTAEQKEEIKKMIFYIWR